MGKSRWQKLANDSFRPELIHAEHEFSNCRCVNVCRKGNSSNTTKGFGVKLCCLAVVTSEFFLEPEEAGGLSILA